MLSYASGYSFSEDRPEDAECASVLGPATTPDLRQRPQMCGTMVQFRGTRLDLVNFIRGHWTTGEMVPTRDAQAWPGPRPFHGWPDGTHPRIIGPSGPQRDDLRT